MGSVCLEYTENDELQHWALFDSAYRLGILKTTIYFLLWLYTEEWVLND